MGPRLFRRIRSRPRTLALWAASRSGWAGQTSRFPEDWPLSVSTDQIVPRYPFSVSGVGLKSGLLSGLRDFVEYAGGVVTFGDDCYAF